MTIIGITGGTGGGKTTALEVISERGGLVLDCDHIYHELAKTSEVMLTDLNTRFPGVVTDGVLDTKALGRIVFSDEKELSDLNAITHHYVRIEIEKKLTEWSNCGGKLVAIDAIALFESGIDGFCQFTVGIIADPETRAKRIMAREGIDRDYAILRINAQKPDSFFIDKCDYIIENNYTHPDLFKNKCREFFTEKVSNTHE